MATQADIDALTARLTASATKLNGLTIPSDVDITALSAAVTSVEQAVDAKVPAAP